MPIVNISEKFPDWCEVKKFEIHSLGDNQKSIYNPDYQKSVVIVLEGSVTTQVQNETKNIKGGESVFATSEPILLNGTGSKVMAIYGNWGENIGGIGIFWVEKIDNPINPGTPADYNRNTSFDNHYHDCDEYWIIYKGKGLVYSEGKEYEVKPEDCVVTETGEHHDFPVVYETVWSVFFETTMSGDGRRGHLWTK